MKKTTVALFSTRLMTAGGSALAMDEMKKGEMSQDGIARDDISTTAWPRTRR